jgi:P27 family predicted phage terminase small subunit
MGAPKGSNNQGGRRLKPIDGRKSYVRPEEREKLESIEEQMSVLDDLPDDPPAYIPTYGKKLWKQLVPQLKQLHLLKEIDQSVLELMCTFYDTWIRATRDVKKQGIAPDGVHKNPAFTVMKESSVQIKQCARELGLTYASRSSMLPTKKKDNDKPSGFFQMFGGGA